MSTPTSEKQSNEIELAGLTAALRLSMHEIGWQLGADYSGRYLSDQGAESSTPNEAGRDKPRYCRGE